jgi:hypothetical protein
MPFCGTNGNGHKTQLDQYGYSANVPFACRAVDVDPAPDAAPRADVLACVPLAFASSYLNPSPEPPVLT